MYIEIAQLEAHLPEEFIIEALDDDGDGIVDAVVWQKIQETVSRKIDGILGQRFSVPFAGVIPVVVYGAAEVFALDLLYRRRGYHGDDNPYSIPAAGAEKRLVKIANGESPLEPGKPNDRRTSVQVIGERSRITPSNGSNLI